MLSAKELAAMRATVSGGLPELCTVKRLLLSPDGQGGYTEAWSTAYDNVPCRLKPAGQGSRSGLQPGGQWHVASAWTLTVAYDQPLSTGERVLFGGETYVVLSVDDAASERVHRQAYLRRLDG